MSDGAESTIDCGSDSNYEANDYMFGSRCREPVQELPVIAEFVWIVRLY